MVGHFCFEQDAGKVVSDGKSQWPDFITVRLLPAQALEIAIQIIRCVQEKQPVDIMLAGQISCEEDSDKTVV